MSTAERGPPALSGPCSSGCQPRRPPGSCGQQALPEREGGRGGERKIHTYAHVWEREDTQ